MLFDTAEKLVGFEFVFARSGAAQETNVKDNNVAAPRFDTLEYVGQMVEIVMIAYRDEDVAGPSTDGLWSEFSF